MRTTILARNVFSGLAAQVWTVCLGLAALPLYVRRLGPDGYGLLALCFMVVGTGGLMDLGLGRSLGKYIAEASGPGQEQSARDLFRVSFSLALLLGLACGAGCIATAGWVAKYVFHAPPEMQHSAVICLRLLGLGFPGLLVGLAYQGLLVGYERIAFLGLLSAISNTLKVGGGAILLLLGYGLPWVVGAYMLGSQIYSLLLFLYAQRRLPQTFLPSLGWDLGLARKLLTLGGIGTICSLMLLLFISADRVMIAWLLPFAFVGYYSGCANIANRQCYIANNVSQAFLPIFSAETRQPLEFRIRSYRLATRAVAAGSSGLAAVLIALAHPLITIWLGADYALHAQAAMVWLCLGALLANYATITYTLVFATSTRPEVFAAFYAMAMALHLGLSLFLVHRWGVTAVAFAYFAGYVLVWGVSLRWIHRRILPLSSGTLLRDCFLPSWTVSAAVALPAWWWLEPHLHGIWSLLLAGSFCYAAYLAGLTFWGFNAGERTRILSVGRRALGLSPS